jgi:hypothetical protein
VRRVGTDNPGPGWPLPNVWLGTSVEDQQRADERIPHLLRCPAAVRWLSCEPLLGPVDLAHVLGGGYVTIRNGETLPAAVNNQPLNWIVAGGESGNGARPCDLAWIRSITRQCQDARVPVFVKQLGAQPYYIEPCPPGQEGADIEGVPDSCTADLYTPDPKGGNPDYWPADLRVRQMPEVAAYLGGVPR